MRTPHLRRGAAPAAYPPAGEALANGQGAAGATPDAPSDQGAAGANPDAPSGRLLQIYVATLVCVAAAVIAADLVMVPAGPPAGQPIVWLAIVVLSIGAEHVSFRLHGGWTSAAGTLPHIAAAFLLPPGLAELVAVIGAVSYGITRRRSTTKVLFNLAVVVLAVSAAAHVAVAFGGFGLLVSQAGWWGAPIAVLASGAYYLVSVATVSVAVGLDRHLSIWQLARPKLGLLALADLGLGLIGATLALVLSVSPGWAPALILPALLVYLVKRSHEALRGSEARLQAMVASATDAIVTLDSAGRVVLFNRAAETMFDQRASDAVGRQLGDRLLPAIDEGSKQHVQVGVARRTTGETFPVELSSSEIEIMGERLTTLILRDITQRYRVEAERAELLAREQQAREEAEHALQARDEFLTLAAHELRTPVTSLRAYAQLLQRVLRPGELLDAARLGRALTAIDQQSAKLARMVSLLLDVSSIETGTLVLDLQDTDLSQLVQQTVEAARSRSATRGFIVRAAPNLGAHVDPQRIGQVLSNLLDNAIRYSAEDALVEVELTAQEDNRLRLEVRDHGSGIPAEARQHLFDRFYRAHAADHASGLGLGLHLGRKIVELHGGALTAEFPSADGACFSVNLPGSGSKPSLASPSQLAA